jgi:hypothetical protein
VGANKYSKHRTAGLRADTYTIHALPLALETSRTGWLFLIAF